MNNESWKKIVIDGQETVYSVSNRGRIRNDKTMTFLEGYIANNGYRMVHLRYRVDKMCSVHRLVAKAFMPREDMDCLQINHIDGNKDNNDISNLEWSTALDNMRHSFREGLQPKELKNCYVYDLQGNFIEEFETVADAARKYKMNPANIHKCINLECTKNGNYMFKPFKKQKIAPWHNPNMKKIYLYYEDGSFIENFDSQNDCAKYLGVSPATISKAINQDNCKFHEFIISKIPLIG